MQYLPVLHFIVSDWDSVKVVSQHTREVIMSEHHGDNVYI